MTYSENQVRHLYVHTASTDPVTLSTSADGKKIWFNTTSVDGSALRSDLIEKKKVLSCTLTAEAKMERKTVVKTITIPTTVTASDEYYVRVAFRQFAGQTDSDTYAKYAHAVAKSTTGSAVADDLAAILKANFAADASKLVEIVHTAETAIIKIKEVEQPYRKGIMESVPVYFDVTVQKVSDNNVVEDVTSSIVTDTTSDDGTTIKNSKKTADLEYFLLGERGDQYRGMGFPYTYETQGKVDPNSAAGYDYIDIHYYTDECGTNNDRSEKTLTIVGAPSSLASLKTAIDNALNS